ncbi:MAG: hypothetical protein QME25_02225 [Bacteroidota bacterium]|nr:hypothetical protein [Bacteroidota bacterium]
MTYASPTSVWREGQVDDSVKYLARSAGRVTYFFMQEDMTMLLTKKETEKETRSDVRMTLFGIDTEKQYIKRNYL